MNLSDLFGIVLLVVLVLGIILVPLVYFLYHAALNKRQATFVQEGTIEFVVAGETLVKMIENIRGWHYQKGAAQFPTRSRKSVKEADGKLIWEDPRDNSVLVYDSIVPDRDSPETNSIDPVVKVTLQGNKPSSKKAWWRKLEVKWGFFWVSLFYPLRRIYEFSIIHARLESETAITKDTPLEKWITVVEEQDKFLLWRFPRPILVRNVEFKDQFEGNLLIMAYFQVVNPYPFVFVYKKKFFLLLEKAVQAAVIDYIRTQKYTDFITTKKTGPLSDFFWEAVEGINWVGIDRTTSQGIVYEFGVYVRDAWIVHIELSEEDSAAKDALKANEIARLAGEAKKTTALAQAVAITTIANAEAGALKAQIDASSEAVMIAKLRKEALIENKIVTTLVEHGAVQINR